MSVYEFYNLPKKLNANQVFIHIVKVKHSQLLVHSGNSECCSATMRHTWWWEWVLPSNKCFWRPQGARCWCVNQTPSTLPWRNCHFKLMTNTTPYLCGVSDWGKLHSDGLAALLSLWSLMKTSFDTHKDTVMLPSFLHSIPLWYRISQDSNDELRQWQVLLGHNTD